MRRMRFALLYIALTGLVLAPVMHQHPIGIRSSQEITKDKQGSQVTQACLVCPFGAPGAIVQPSLSVPTPTASGRVTDCATRTELSTPLLPRLSRGPPVV